MFDFAFQSDIISSVKNIAIFLMFIYISGASIMWIVLWPFYLVFF